MKKNATLTAIIFLLTLSIHAQNEDKRSYIKKNLPLCYAVIVKESGVKWSGDYTKQLGMIKRQCAALFHYMELDSIKPEIPEIAFGDIQVKTVFKWSKNPDSSLDKCLNCMTYFTRLDCMDSKLNVDWEMVISDIAEQVKSYKELRK
jgi:hypothetical protein